MKHGIGYDKKLLAYLEGELAQAEAAQMAGHVAGCPRCQKKIAHFQSDLDIIQGLFEAPPRNGIAPTIERIRSQARGVKARKTTLRIGVVGATCALAVAALWAFSRPAPGGFQPMPPRGEVRFADLGPEIAALKIEVAQLQRTVRMNAPISSTNIHDEEIAAILVQAGKNLDTKFGLKDEARKRYQWAADAYGGSVAGAEAKILLVKLESR